jgi:hypothetical protein
VALTLVTFKDNFKTTDVDNKAPRRDQMGEMRNRVTGEAVIISPNDLRDIRGAWLPPQEAFSNSHSNLHYSLSRIGRTPGLTDRLVKTDPAYAAIWFLD